MKRTLLLLILSLIAVVCKSQEPIAECLFVNDTSIFRQDAYDELFESKNGYILAPNGVIRVLVVFAEIEYDIHPNRDPNPYDTDNWPVGGYPIWRDQLFDHTIHPEPLQGLVTKYFYEASFGSYHVLGDYLINCENNNKIFKIKESDGYDYLSSNASSVLCNKINQNANQSLITHYGYNDIDYFDNWTYTDKGKEKISPSIDNPRRFDCVLFIWRNYIRNNKALNNTGFSTPSLSSSMLFSYGIDYEMNVGTFSNCPTNIIRHEYSHGLLGDNSFHTAGGGNQEDYWIPLSGGWSALGLSGSSLQCCNGWDRQRLGWRPEGSSYELSVHDETNSNRVDGDLDAMNRTGEGIYWLRDFITSGDVIRIKLPFIEASTEYPEYLWVENHTGDSDFDKWQHEGHDCIDSFSGGLMTYVQIDKDIRSDYVMANVFGGYAGYLRPLTANGYYDRSFESRRIFNDCVQWDSTNAFLRCIANPLTGGGDEEHYVVDFNGDNCIKYDDERSNFVEKKENGVYDYKLFMLGHNSHIFNIEGVKKIGVSTNPSTASMMNMVGHDLPRPNAKNIRKICLNGISIEILDRDLEHSLKIRIRFNDVDIDNDVRWCSDSIVLNSIETSSGYSLIVNKGKTILLDQGLTATRMRDPINYNGQKIFASPTTFVVQPDVKIHLDTAANIVLDNSSKLYFRERSSCVIEDRGAIIVRKGTVLQLDDCASLVINGTGKLIVEEGAELRISPLATLVFQNGLQNLIMESGVIIYHIFADPNSLIANTISNAVITSNTTWNGVNCKVVGNIVIESSATLFIESSILRFNDYDGRVIIKQGGKLIIDNSLLKSEHNCSDIWQGIEVWGNSSTHQSSVNGVCGQGFLELKNGAIIENAKCAVELWRPGHYSTTGGILHASDATFLNNAMAVRAVCYSNYNPVTHAEVSYDAYFNNCSFIVNNSYLGTETFHKHVVLVEVDGIDFSGCDFIADRSVNEVHPWCIGISSYDASFSVTSPCMGLTIPCLKENMDYSTFVGLCSGICASGSGINPHTFMVRDVIFNNNDYGINVLNTNFPTILSNDFRIGGGGYCNYNYGVCLRNSTGFCIEENSFHPVPNPTSTTVGVAIYSSNGVNDVYLNDFEGLSRANLAFGDNTNGANSSAPMGPVQGLTYTCNEFTSNQRDIMVLKKNGIGDIQPQQGSAAVPAGNRFKYSTFQLYNDGYSPIDYHYNSNELYETPNTSMLYRVTPNGTTSTNVCSSHYGNNPVVKSPSEKAALEEVYLFAYSNYQGLHQQFEEHMDNDGTIAQLGVYAHGFSLAAGDIVRSNLFDSVANPSELRNWLRNMKDIAADRMAISSYIQEGDSVSAFALARMLPDLYHLQGDQLADHNDYVRLIKLYQSLRNSNRNVFQLNETEMNMVLRMAEEGTGISQSMAQVVIEKIRGRDEDACLTPELPNLGNGDKGGMMNLNADDDETSCLNVTLSPNPATTWTTINYSLPANVTKASLTITNSLGMNMYNTDLEGAAGNKVIDLRGFATGVYIYTIQYEQSIETGKMVITR